jgi:hypothetical protein
MLIDVAQCASFRMARGDLIIADQTASEGLKKSKRLWSDLE